MKRLHAARIPLAIMTAGLLLLLITGRGGKKTEAPLVTQEPATEDSIQTEEARLADFLREIEGVGEVRVLLSYRTSAETEYISDGEEIVILSAGSGRQEALTRLTRYPNYQGAVIVCEGGDNASVRLNVVEAVSRFTGLRADGITVLKLRR